MDDSNTNKSGENGLDPAAQPPGVPTPQAPLPATSPRPGDPGNRKEPSPEDIGRDLSKGQARPIEERVGQARPEEPITFDITKLTGEQLQQLKAMLTVTPERPAAKRSNPFITLRKFVTRDKDGIETSKLIVDFKNAYETSVFDEQANRNKEVVMIPVKFLNEEAFTPVNYRDFMTAEQVRCEVIGTESVPGEINEGEVRSRETGLLIPRITKTLTTFFTVRLPLGTEPASIKVEGRIVNG